MLCARRWGAKPNGKSLGPTSASWEATYLDWATAENASACRTGARNGHRHTCACRKERSVPANLGDRRPVLSAVLPLFSCSRSACRGLLDLSGPVSSRTFRLRGGHEWGCGPGAGPPELPSQPSTSHVAHPDFAEPRLVPPRAPNVGDQEPAAGAQHPNRFVDRFVPAGTPPDVVDRQAGDDHVEAVVFKR